MGRFFNWRWWMYISLVLIVIIVLEILKDKQKIVNRFPGIHGLAHKDTYTQLMKIGLEIDGSIFNFVPP